MRIVDVSNMDNLEDTKFLNFLAAQSEETYARYMSAGKLLNKHEK